MQASSFLRPTRPRWRLPSSVSWSIRLTAVSSGSGAWLGFAGISPGAVQRKKPFPFTARPSMLTVDFGRLDPAAGCRVLDVGCGSGRHTAAAYRLPGAFVVGVDAADSELPAARNRLALHQRLGEHGGGRWALCAADGLHLPFADSRFDLVICAEVLEHVPAHDRAVAEIIRVLRPGGDLVVSVPRRGPELLCWKLSRDYAPANGGHLRIYRKAALIK